MTDFRENAQPGGEETPANAPAPSKPEKKRLFKKGKTMEEKAAAMAAEDDDETKTAKLLRTMPRWRYWTLAVVGLVFLIFQLYIKLVTPLDSWIQMPLHLCLAFIFSILMNPLAEKHHKKWLWVIDGLIVVMSAAIAVYFISNHTFFNFRVFSVDVMRPVDLVFGIALILILIECVRRYVSGVLCVFILFVIAYAFFGQNLTGLFKFSGISWQRLVETLSLGNNGIFGSPTIVSVSTLFYFMVFGTFFTSTGGGQVLIDLGMKLSDKTVGGPAKAAVISSGLMGMISGSAVANVSTTGVLTIPLMKKNGYTPEEAGAVESVASTGGQIMPPIMGVGAFIMAEMIGVKYTEIALSAALPAIFYYFAIFTVVHLLAKKKQCKVENTLKYTSPPILRRAYRLLPIVALVVMIFTGRSLPRAAIDCTALSILIGSLSKETRLGPKKLLNCLLEGVKQASFVALPTAGCGIIIGIVVRSGVAVKFAKLIGTSGASSLLLALGIAAVGCILLGMALPTSAAYLLGNVLFCTAIQKLGIEALPANMFLFYFGVIAQITPPVCVASYTAAGIAGASAWKTGWKGFLFAITGFLVPFLFVYQPAILLMGTAGEIIRACIVVALGTFFLGVGVTGFFRRELRWAERIVMFICAALLILPDTTTDLIGIGISAVMCVYIFLSAKKQKERAHA